jgi:methyltransferase (TIGR00027 family)
MQPALPSQTALRVAMRRAAHQIYDAKPLVLDDPLAVRILGTKYAEEVSRTPTRPDKPFSAALRAFMVARSRYAEDNLAQAVANGMTQYVLLGAGLDTFAYRNPHPGLRVFEVDHPATQAWKHELLGENAIPVPESVAHVPVDFERQSLPEELRTAGFDMDAPAFFTWLGVVPYLTQAAFRATIGFIAERAPGSGVTLDYAQPREALPFFEKLALDSLSERVALAGEPFQLFFRPEEMTAEFAGFGRIENLGSDQLNERYFKGREDTLKLMGTAARLFTAWR